MTCENEPQIAHRGRADVKTQNGRRRNNPDRALTLHEQAIETLLADNPLMRRNGFWAAARELWNRLVVEYEEYAEAFPKMDWLPDAYCVDPESRSLSIFEVVHSHPLSASKRRQIGDFWFEWDCMDFGPWMPRLFIVNRFAAITHEMDMSDFLIEGLLQDAHDKRIADAAIVRGGGR